MFNKKCPKCEYIRKENESTPDYECPNCGIVYEKFEAIQKSKYRNRGSKRTKSVDENSAPPINHSNKSAQSQSPNRSSKAKTKNSDIPFTRVQAKIDTLDIIGHLILWIVLSIITLGIALFFLPYSFSKFIINRTEIIDAEGNKQRLQCSTNIFGNIGHVILWIIITIFTLGLGYFFYMYKVWNYSLNNTEII